MTAPSPDRRRATLRAGLRSGARLVGIDAARAVALFGMMATHLAPRTTPEGEVTVAYLIASGRASALFAVLAGVGLALASGGTTPPRGWSWARASAGTAARAGVVFGAGLVLGEFDSDLAIILCYYGALFLVAIPVLRLSAGWLIALGTASALLTPVLSQWLRGGVVRPFDYAVPSIETLVADPGVMFTGILVTGYYPVLTWTSYLLIGLGVGRLRLDTARVAASLAVVGAVVAALAWSSSERWLASGGLDPLQAAGVGRHPVSGPIGPDLLHVGFYGTTPTTSWAWLRVASPHSGAPPDLVHTIGTALAVLGVMLLLARLLGRARMWVLGPLAAVGSMTFTLYSLHVVLISTALPRTASYPLLAHVAVAVAVAVPWRLLIGRGPLEALAAAAYRSAASRVGPR